MFNQTFHSSQFQCSSNYHRIQTKGPFATSPISEMTQTSNIVINSNKLWHNIFNCSHERQNGYNSDSKYYKMLALCKTRHRRRKISVTNEPLKNTNSVKIHPDENEVDKQSQLTFNTWNKASDFKKYMNSLSQNTTNCKEVSLLMLNHTHLKFIDKSLKEFGCKSQKVSYLLSELRGISLTHLSLEGHRSHMERKHRHLSCKLFREYKACASNKNADSLSPNISTDHHTEPSNNKVKATTHMNKVLQPDESTTASRLEANHVSDSSKVDYMPFMIGSSKYWADEYEMWFY